MKPKDFKESNKTLAKPNALTDSECGDLKVYSNGRECVSLWNPSIRERISILFHGNVWLSIHSGASQPPVWLDGRKTIFENKRNISLRDKIELHIEQLKFKYRNK